MKFEIVLDNLEKLGFVYIEESDSGSFIRFIKDNVVVSFVEE